METSRGELRGAQGDGRREGQGGDAARHDGEGETEGGRRGEASRAKTSRARVIGEMRIRAQPWGGSR